MRFYDHLAYAAEREPRKKQRTCTEGCLVVVGTPQCRFRNELQGHSGPFQKEVVQLLGKFVVLHCSAFSLTDRCITGSYPVWEDFINKAGKLQSQLRTTVVAAAAFLDAFQKVADMATNTRDVFPGWFLSALCAAASFCFAISPFRSVLTWTSVFFPVSQPAVFSCQPEEISPGIEELGKMSERTFRRYRAREKSCRKFQLRRLVSQNAGSTVVIWSAWRQLPRRDDELVKGQIGAVSWLRAGSPDLLGSRRTLCHALSQVSRQKTVHVCPACGHSPLLPSPLQVISRRCDSSHICIPAASREALHVRSSDELSSGKQCPGRLFWRAGEESCWFLNFPGKSASAQDKKRIVPPVFLFSHTRQSPTWLLACKRERVFSSNEAVEKRCSLCSSHPQAGFVETTSKRTAVAIVILQGEQQLSVSVSHFGSKEAKEKPSEEIRCPHGARNAPLSTDLTLVLVTVRNHSSGMQALLGSKQQAPQWSEVLLLPAAWLKKGSHRSTEPGRWGAAGRLEELAAMRRHQHTPRAAARGAVILQEERQPRQTVLEAVWSSEMKDPEALFSPAEDSVNQDGFWGSTLVFRDIPMQIPEFLTRFHLHACLFYVLQLVPNVTFVCARGVEMWCRMQILEMVKQHPQTWSATAAALPALSHDKGEGGGGWLHPRWACFQKRDASFVCLGHAAGREPPSILNVAFYFNQMGIKSLDPPGCRSQRLRVSPPEAAGLGFCICREHLPKVRTEPALAFCQTAERKPVGLGRSRERDPAWQGFDAAVLGTRRGRQLNCATAARHP
ncbi:Metastasis suppressor protein 1 [Anas platyrhynchos]|uniref:Metastasis suppressor protein 1 n=1 Tax=Anas platyrhynchos TaxID=8839 RepID=R0LKQ6_ANAPL|nr:Metastasis suppressor protein 1 [Anas platyrhynchos]